MKQRLTKRAPDEGRAAVLKNNLVIRPSRVTQSVGRFLANGGKYEHGIYS